MTCWQVFLTILFCILVHITKNCQGAVFEANFRALEQSIMEKEKTGKTEKPLKRGKNSRDPGNPPGSCIPPGKDSRKYCKTEGRSAEVE